MTTIQKFLEKYPAQAHVLINNTASLTYRFFTGRCYQVRLSEQGDFFSVSITNLSKTEDVVVGSDVDIFSYPQYTLLGQLFEDYHVEQKVREGKKALERLERLEDLHRDLLSHLPLALQCDDLENQMKLLINHFRYIPGSEAYNQAKSEFDVRKGSQHFVGVETVNFTNSSDQ